MIGVRAKTVVVHVSFMAGETEIDQVVDEFLDDGSKTFERGNLFELRGEAFVVSSVQAWAAMGNGVDYALVLVRCDRVEEIPPPA